MVKHTGHFPLDFRFKGHVFDVGHNCPRIQARMAVAGMFFKRSVFLTRNEDTFVCVVSQPMYNMDGLWFSRDFGRSMRFVKRRRRQGRESSS